jgi:hypothetical protein
MTYFFLLIWLAAQAVTAAVVWRFTLGLNRPEPPLTKPPRLAIIVAVKGYDRAAFDGFLDLLLTQDYPIYRVIFAVEDINDGAVPLIEMQRAKYPDHVSLVIAGPGQDEGQKTTNLRAAAERLTADDEIIVLADADIWPQRDWLMRLVKPLVCNTADVVSGFSWLVPKDRRLSSFVIASMAASIATLPRFWFMNGCWGGSTALTRRRFEELGFPEAWRGTLSDDLHLTNLAQRAGLRLGVPRELLLRTSFTTTGFNEVAAGVRRWYMLVRVHLPAAYAATLAAVSFGAAGWIAVLAGALLGNLEAAYILAAALALNVLRSAGRAVIVARLWGRRGLAENWAFLLADPVVTPAALIFNAALGWSALALRRTTWAGITYEMLGPKRVNVLTREKS